MYGQRRCRKLSGQLAGQLAVLLLYRPSWHLEPGAPTMPAVAVNHLFLDELNGNVSRKQHRSQWQSSLVYNNFKYTCFSVCFIDGKLLLFQKK